MDIIKFPSIEQYRSAIRNVSQRVRYKGQDENDQPIMDFSPLPTIRYRGTVKLHGTNAGIVYDYQTEQFNFQSRERILTLQQDNSGFMLAMSARLDPLRAIIAQYRGEARPDAIVLFGEWCGQGIQKSVAITALPKMFVIFAVRFVYTDHNEWVELNPAYSAPDQHIYCIEQFPYYDLEIDFQYAELSQQKLIEITEAVEQECPVGKHFGVSGVGEGVVWRATDPGWRSSQYWFKVKGEKHSVSKVKTLAPVDVEAVANMREFVERVATEQRFLQGVQWLKTEAQKPLEMTSMGDYIRWVVNDVIKEEQDTIIASQLDVKKMGRPLSDKCRAWYIEYLTEHL